MRKAFLASALLIVACESKTKPPATAEGPQFQVAIGDVEDEGPLLSFEISKIHDTPPVAVDREGWTFFDAKLAEGTVFTVGMHLGREAPAAMGFGGFGDGMFIVKDGKTGGAFAKAFAKAFRVKSASATKPPAASPPPLRFGTAVLSRGAGRYEGGGFGANGTWVATKIFPEFDGEQGEVFFNYDLVTKRGEFTEKDESYDQTVADIFTAALRDGPLPPRTPETDPNLTNDGPKLSAWKKVAERVRVVSEVDGNLFLANGPSLSTYALRTGEMKPIVAFDEGAVNDVVCRSAKAKNCIVALGKPEHPGMFSSADPVEVYRVVGGRATRIEVPIQHAILPKDALSPSGRFVVLSGKKTMIFDLKKNAGAFVGDEEPTTFDRWEKDRAVLYRGNSWDPVESRVYIYADGAKASAPKPEPRASFDGEKITIGKKAFVVHPDDRKHIFEECCRYLTPRYVALGIKRSPVVDSKTLKMSYLQSPDDRRHPSFSSDFSYAYASADQVLFVAEVVR